MQIISIGMQRGIITTDPIGIKRKIKEFYGQSYVHEFGKLDEWTNPLEHTKY